uniref:7TM_GPCR_Srx domain-containing protein n=1 Tax=Heterorhabditis bacteriophora TaxID=37862 RepID=A0A1I7X543_HETBA
MLLLIFLFAACNWQLMTYFVVDVLGSSSTLALS